MRSIYKSIFSTALLLITVSSLYAQTTPVPQAIPYQQDYSALTHASSTYPAGIQGWKVSSAATNVFVTTGPTADHTLTASASASTNSGGVHNYNGKIGMLSSGSSNPGIVLAINTTGASNIELSYDIMVIRNPYDGGSNTRINESTVQYRIGNTGAFTTLTGIEYVSGTTLQTTAGVTTPQNLESRSITLPIACENQAEVQIRWVMRDMTGAGSRPSFAVDNIVVEQDADGDGYGALSDCDDNNADINPGATEICDGIDNNCDGNTDDVILAAPSISPSGVITLCKPDAVSLSVATGYSSYQWYKNGNLIAGATSDSYNTNKPGYYSVMVTQGLCSATSDNQAVAVSPAPFANITAPQGTDLCAGEVKLKASYNATYTYQWYLDDAPVAGTSYLYYPEVAGNYYCVVTTENGCSRTTATIAVTNACRIGSTNENVNIYPNPSNGSFTINFSTDQTNATNGIIKIYNITGALVFENNVTMNQGIFETTMQLQNIESGLYFVKINIEGKEYSNTIVVQ